jgi:hypothetical protein
VVAHLLKPLADAILHGISPRLASGSPTVLTSSEALRALGAASDAPLRQAPRRR